MRGPHRRTRVVKNNFTIEETSGSWGGLLTPSDFAELIEQAHLDAERIRDKKESRRASVTPLEKLYLTEGTNIRFLKEVLLYEVNAK